MKVTARTQIISFLAILLCSAPIDNLIFNWLRFGIYITAPGLLLLPLVIKHPKLDAKAMIYGVSLSILSLYLLGLLANFLVPALGVEEPLGVNPISTIVVVFSTGLFAIGLLKSRLYAEEHKEIQHQTIAIIALASAGIILTIFAVRDLDSATKLVASPLAVGVFVLCGAMIVFGISSNKFTDDDSIILLYGVALSLLLLTSLRSPELSGHDVLPEYRVFSLAQPEKYWSVSALSDAYNACLSITIFPVVMNSLTGLEAAQIFKISYQLIFAFLPVTAFLLFRQYIDRKFALLAAVVVISIPTFYLDLPMMVRQQMALLFFAALLLAISDEENNIKSALILAILFSLGLVLSHYSTALISAAFFGVCAVMAAASLLVFKRSLWQDTVMARVSTPLLVLVICTIAWYGPLTETGQGMEKRVVAGLQESTSLLSNIETPRKIIEGFSSSPKEPSRALLVQYADQTKKDYQHKVNNLISTEKIPEVSIRYASTPNTINPTQSAIYRTVDSTVKQIVKLLLIVGAAIMTYSIFRYRKSPPTVLQIACIAGVILLAMMTIIQITSREYSTFRVFQQVLICSAALIFIPIMYVSRKKPQLSLWVATTITISYFIIYAQIVPAVLGIGSPQYNLGSGGEYYDRYYISSNDHATMEWMAQHVNNDDPTYAGHIETTRILTFTNITHVRKDVFAFSVSEDGYVYSSETNHLKERGFVYVNGQVIGYNYPNEFLENHKGTIYSNAQSVVYR